MVKENKIVFSTLFLHNPHMIPPWVEYHTLIGVDYFYLYYHEKLTDEIRDIVSPYNNVELIEWNVGKRLIHELPNESNSYKTIPGIGWHHAQMAQLWDTASRVGAIFDWVGNFDLDEFLVFENHTNIKDFLGQYDPEVDFYLKFPCNWAMLDKMTEGEYLNFNLSDLINRDTLTAKIHRNNDREWVSINDVGSGKYIYSPRLLEGVAMLKVHNIDLGNNLVGIYLAEFPDRKIHNTDTTYYLHYKNMTYKRTRKRLTRVDWALYYEQLGGVNKKLYENQEFKVNDRIKKIIEENKND
jgi:hypothetical protein